MKYTVSIDDKYDHYLHQATCGHAFALDPRTKLAVFGGQYNTTLININEPSNIIKQINLKPPIKSYVTNYEWDPFNSLMSDSTNSAAPPRFLQTRDKLIEIVNIEGTDPVATLSGHVRPINEAKWSPFRRNTIASSSIDGNLFIWTTELSKPVNKISSIGEVDCVAWSKVKDGVIAVSSNNDIRIYDIRKSNNPLRYLTNAHSKKIFSIDWCNTQSEEILLSASRDRNIKLWNFNMVNQKFMEKIIEDFPCWKAKFTPFGLSFTVIPTCQKSINVTNTILPTVSNTIPSDAAKLNGSINDNTDKNNNSSHNNNNSNNNGNNNSISGNTAQRKNEVAPLLVCQITSLHEARLNRFLIPDSDMIMNYDFYMQNDKFNIVSWTRDQNLCFHTLDSQQIVTNRELERTKSKEDEDLISNKMISYNQSSTLAKNTGFPALQTNTTNSSRKSSFSEYGSGTVIGPVISGSNYGTPPASSILSSRPFNSSISSNININGTIEIIPRDNSISEEQPFRNDPLRPFSSITNPQSLLKSSSSALISHDDFLKYNPKVFGARFSGRPEQFIMFINEGDNFYHSSSKSGSKDTEVKRVKNHQKLNKPSTKFLGKQMSGAKRAQSTVHVFDISALLNLRRDMAEKYKISGCKIDKICDQNKLVAAQYNRYDIVKIWDLLKFITINDSKNMSLSMNPLLGRPWSCSVFGRPLVNSIIDNLIKENDIQSACMVISKLKLHDLNIKTDLNDENVTINEYYNRSSDLIEHQKNLGLLDPMRLKEFDNIVKFYCDLLYRWGLFNKRVEMFEFLNKKPADLDEKFEFPKRCIKCGKKTNSSKCNSKECNSFLVFCSLCELPVNGLATYCAICGHGGHYDHLIEWFKQHEDCPSACGCRCVDFI